MDNPEFINQLLWDKLTEPQPSPPSSAFPSAVASPTETKFSSPCASPKQLNAGDPMYHIDSEVSLLFMFLLP